MPALVVTYNPSEFLPSKCLKLVLFFMVLNIIPCMILQNMIPIQICLIQKTIMKVKNSLQILIPISLIEPLLCLTVNVIFDLGCLAYKPQPIQSLKTHVSQWIYKSDSFTHQVLFEYLLYRRNNVRL